MEFKERIDRLLELYREGMYIPLELFGMFIMKTPQENLGELKELLPHDIWTPFAEWIDEYPLEGGFQIRSGPRLPIEKIIWLKEFIKNSSPPVE